MSNVDIYYNNGRCVLNNQKCEGGSGFVFANGKSADGHDCRFCSVPIVVTIKEKK